MYFTAVGELQYQSYQLDAMTINNNALVIISQLAFSTAVPIIAINNIDMSWAVVATVLGCGSYSKDLYQDNKLGTISKVLNYCNYCCMA